MADPRAFQILSTEHYSLLATRSLAYNEAFARAGMHLSFLSASLIVIGLLVAPLGMRSTLAAITTVLLAADLFIGLATLGRLNTAGQEELDCVRGMNRIRHAYREMLPEVEPYFVTGFHDDAAGVLSAYKVAPSGVLGSLAHGLTTTPGMIAAINALVAGALAAVLTLALGLEAPLAGLAGVVGFGVMFGAELVYSIRFANAQRMSAGSIFPMPDA